MSGLYKLWFRLVYLPLFRSRKVTSCLRPGDRRYPNPKGASVGDFAIVEFILVPGDDELGKAPVLDSFRLKVRITQIRVGKFGELQDRDLEDCSPDCKTKEAARCHLGLIYNKIFEDDDVVSIVHFVYLD